MRHFWLAQNVTKMTLLAELEEFVVDHRPYGSLTADATPPACAIDSPSPARMAVAFERWVTLTDAELDLLRAAGLN